MKKTVMADRIMEFYGKLARVDIKLPKPYYLKNPFASENASQVMDVVRAFYSKFYSDENSRILILGSSPARRGTAVAGVPFEDAGHLFQIAGIKIPGFQINRASSNFLYDVIDRFGGREKFYSRFYLNFVCPLGIVKRSDNGNEVNCNYYENKQLGQVLDEFIVQSLKQQMSFNIDRSVCFCIGSGENFSYLERINEKHHFFDKIIPLEHPRFIMQYNSKDKEKYLDKYIRALRGENCGEEANEKVK